MNRIKTLLLYDWLQDRHRVGYCALIFAAIYLLFALGAFFNATAGNLSEQEPYIMPYRIIAACSIPMSYGVYAVIILVTTVLHRKFTTRRTATSYLALPASAAEKCSVMLIEYAAAYLGFWLAGTVALTLTVAVGAIFFPQCTWWSCLWGILSYDEAAIWQYGMAYSPEAANALPAEFNSLLQHGLSHHITILRLTGIFLSIDCLGLYIILNLHFRRQQQLKSIGVFALLFIIVMIVFIIYTVVVMTDSFSDAKFDPIDYGQKLILVMRNIGYWSLISIPVLPLIYWKVYRQILNCQAR